jgi:Bacterial Ig-like domain (group 3)
VLALGGIASAAVARSAPVTPRAARKGVIMRLRVNRLVYVLVGAALAVGFLVSATARPESVLTASEACYGPCQSVMALSLSSSTVTYDHEQVEKFSIRVSAGAPGTGVPTGRVVVRSGTRTLCRIHLSRGKGGCSPVAKALRPGSYEVVAYYSGDKNFRPSTSRLKTLTVLDPSVTALSLSRSTVTYGHERTVRFSVKVSAGAPGTGVPTGLVVVRFWSRTLCSVHLFRGKGSCSPAARALRPGWHKIVAYYGGDRNFTPSTSREKTLTVDWPRQ